jgi:hypothetical protein
MNVEEQLAGLLAREEIRELVTSRFSSAVDWLDHAGMKACFTDDASVAFGTFSMSAADFVDFWCKMGAGFRTRYHLITCANIVLDGDRARTEARGIVVGVAPDADKGGKLRDAIEGSRYYCDLVRQTYTWKIARMQIVFDWSLVQPSADVTAAGSPFETGLDTSHWLYRHMKTGD